jgi:hypothetical protein
MPRYFFDVWRDDEEEQDEEGSDLADLAAVKAELFEAVAELAKEDIRARPADRRALSSKYGMRTGEAYFRHSSNLTCSRWIRMPHP